MSATTRRNSASLLAYRYYWNQYPPGDFCKTWMMLCYPFEVLYIRRLTLTERVDIVYAGDESKVWYGAFHQFTFSLLAVADSYDCLVSSALKQGCLPMYAH
jgi:hypothetical protein